MTLAISNNLNNGARVSNGDVVGTITALDKFVSENNEMFEQYLVLDAGAWSTDESHARKFGSVLCLDFSASGEYKYEMRHTVAEYLRDPRGYNASRRPFRQFKADPTQPYNGYLTVVVVPTATASQRQLSQFSTVKDFMGAMGAEWNRRMRLNSEVTGQLNAALAAHAASPAQVAAQ